MVNVIARKDDKGKLIVVEGIDGAGKTTLSKGLADRIRAGGYPIQVVNRYMIPELTHLWQRLIASDSVNQDMAAALAIADYYVGLERCIRPALNAGAIVLADRYYYSHLVYFALRGVSLSRLLVAFQEALAPDSILYLGVTIETALRRLRAKQKPDIWEAGLDYRLGLSIGRAVDAYQDRQLTSELIELHFREHQTQSLKLYPLVLPPERTSYLDGDLAENEVLRRSVAEINRIIAL